MVGVSLDEVNNGKSKKHPVSTYLGRAKELDLKVSEQDKKIIRNNLFCIDAYGYPVTNVKREDGLWVTTRLHHLIFSKKDGLVIDHINGNKKDNRRDNLRYCTQQENCWNRSRDKNNTSGFTGVSWSKSKRKWEAYIWYKYKKISLGRHVNLEDAVKARQDKEIELYGEYRRRRITGHDVAAITYLVLVLGICQYIALFTNLVPIGY